MSLLLCGWWGRRGGGGDGCIREVVVVLAEPGEFHVVLQLALRREKDENRRNLRQRKHNNHKIGRCHRMAWNDRRQIMTKHQHFLTCPCLSPRFMSPSNSLLSAYRTRPQPSNRSAAHAPTKMQKMQKMQKKQKMRSEKFAD